MRTPPGPPQPRGVLIAGGRAIPVALGRAGIRANKREGDGATPARPVSAACGCGGGPTGGRGRATRPAGPPDSHRHVAWCEDPADRRYNRPFRRSANEPGDRLWRDDHLYDLIIEIDHNTRPRIAGRGSAVFLHVARPDRGPTAGCVAMAAADLRRLLARLCAKNENL